MIAVKENWRCSGTEIKLGNIFYLRFCSVFTEGENMVFLRPWCLICGYACVCFIFSTVQAQEFDYYPYIAKYARCEAIQNVMANVASESEQEFFQHALHHASLASRKIALAFAKAGSYPAGMVDELYQTYLDEYRQQLRSNAQAESLIAALRPYVKKCQHLLDMQADLIVDPKTNALYQDEP